MKKLFILVLALLLTACSPTQLTYKSIPFKVYLTENTGIDYADFEKAQLYEITSADSLPKLGQKFNIQFLDLPFNEHERYFMAVFTEGGCPEGLIDVRTKGSELELTIEPSYKGKEFSCNTQLKAKSIIFAIDETSIEKVKINDEYVELKTI